MDTVLQGLFHAFSMKCVQLRKAVDLGQDDLVRLVDRELEPIINDIVDYRASTAADVRAQLQFLSTVIREEADDKSAVVRRTAALSSLIDRYFMDGNERTQPCGFSPLSTNIKPGPGDGYDQTLFNEAVLDSLTERVAVVTKDYRYLYTNQENARVLKRNRLSLIGCHVSELIGEESFRSQAKPAFDRCFAGETIAYVHHGYRYRRDFSTRCRMTPLRAANNTIVGAVVVMQTTDEMAALERG